MQGLEESETVWKEPSNIVHIAELFLFAKSCMYGAFSTVMPVPAKSISAMQREVFPTRVRILHLLVVVQAGSMAKHES